MWMPASIVVLDIHEMSQQSSEVVAMFSESLKRHLRKALRLNRWERNGNGIYIGTQDDLTFRGAFGTQFLFGPSFRELGPDLRIETNKIVDQGLILAVIDALANGTQVAQWYVMPAKGAGTPQSTWTGQNVSANFGEFSNYDEATRPALVLPDPTTIVTPSISNSASLAVTTIGSGSDKTLTGGAIVSANTKGDANAGSKCWSAVKFGTARSGLQTGDGIGWNYGLTASSSS